MPDRDSFYDGRRISYDGALCTLRCKVSSIPKTKGDWLGVEWDDSARGKHNGTLNGVKYFQCRSNRPTVASFVRPTRKPDVQRTVLEAIKYKYAADQSQTENKEALVISGKVAEEVGFEKIIKAQSKLANLKVVILDFMVITGVAPIGSPPATVRQAQEELAKTCPNVTELDLSYNPIESWTDVENICAALPNLRVLKLNSVRFRDLTSPLRSSTQDCFLNTKELHLNECLLTAPEVIGILQGSGRLRFPALQSLWLSQNELSSFSVPFSLPAGGFGTIQSLMLENNMFTSLDPVASILAMFPQVSHISLQSNKISSFGSGLKQSGQQFTHFHHLDLSHNNIDSFDFVDQLPQVFPALSALRISKTAIYDRQSTDMQSVKPTETSYYLTLARIPSLKTLNYTDITAREREEGEIYYLSVAEKDIRNTFANIDAKDSQAKASTLNILTQRYPRYGPLCEKHDRDNIIAQLSSATGSSADLTKNASSSDSQQVYPPGTLASRLVTATFYLADSSTNTPKAFTRPIPNTIPTSSIFALVSRELHLAPLTFKLIYESDELDPVRDDLTTRSQMYDDRAWGAKRWDDWGDWDADAAVERSLRPKGDADEEESGVEEGRWTDAGILVKDGKKWRKRMVEMLFGRGSWGDWLDQGVRSCKARVEPVDKKKF